MTHRFHSWLRLPTNSFIGKDRKYFATISGAFPEPTGPQFEPALGPTAAVFYFWPTAFPISRSYQAATKQLSTDIIINQME